MSREMLRLATEVRERYPKEAEQIRKCREAIVHSRQTGDLEGEAEAKLTIGKIIAKIPELHILCTAPSY